MVEKKDTDVTSEAYKPKLTVGSKFITATEKLVPTEFTMTEKR